MKWTLLVLGLLAIGINATAETQAEQHQKAGLAAWHSGNVDLTIKEFREAVRFAPTDTLVRDQLIFALDEKIKQIEAEVRKLKTAPKNEPQKKEIPATSPYPDGISVTGCRLSGGGPPKKAGTIRSARSVWRSAMKAGARSGLDWTAKGIVTNNSTKTYTGIAATICYYDKRGMQVHTSTVYADSLAPKRSWEFTDYVTDMALSGFDVVSISAR